MKVTASAITCMDVINEYIALGCADGSVRFFDFSLRLEAWFEDISAGRIASLSFALQDPPFLDKMDVGNPGLKFWAPNFIVKMIKLNLKLFLDIGRQYFKLYCMYCRLEQKKRILWRWTVRSFMRCRRRTDAEECFFRACPTTSPVPPVILMILSSPLRATMAFCSYGTMRIRPYLQYVNLVRSLKMPPSLEGEWAEPKQRESACFNFFTLCTRAFLSICVIIVKSV